MKSFLKSKISVVLAVCTLFITICLLLPLVASALTVETSWTYQEEEQLSITGFRIYDGNHVVIVDNIAASERMVTFTVDLASGQATSWYIVAYKAYTEGDEEVSWPSNNIIYAPERETPVSPTGYGIGANGYEDTEKEAGVTMSKTGNVTKVKKGMFKGRFTE